MNGPTHGGVVCQCGRIMRVLKNSVTVEELMDDGASYRLWDADLFRCPDCGVEIITGFGKGPMAEHYEPTYEAQRARLAPLYPARCRTEQEQDSRRLAQEVRALRSPSFPRE